MKPGFSSKASVSSHKCRFHPNLATKKNTKREIVCPFCLGYENSLKELEEHFNDPGCDYDMEDDSEDDFEDIDLKDYRKPGDKYFCNVCSEASRTEEKLQMHVYDCHPACLKCGVGFKYSHQYDEHMKNCEAEFDYSKLSKKTEKQCPICKKVFYNLYQLKRHLEDKHLIRKRK